MTADIAIVGMACRYPDARSPEELWENALAGRRAFRRIPRERLSLEDYFSADRSADDATYSTEAAVIEGYEFDRMRFRVAGSTFRSADMVHWLALDVADAALTDAGFADAGFAAAEGVPRDATGVYVGNSLTGEFSRANLMRLRWPYVRRVLDAELDQRGWPADERTLLLDAFERRYKEPFPPVTDETLAGGLSNTIAGRICNYFDFKGGGYTVDGACASSLLAVATACSALAAGDVDVALAGGVDLSLDPFELVGFARVGALAADDMRVYDARSAGFWPGEGCGMVVLMRTADALAGGRPIYARIRGWGISSDGSGGITRPEEAGQRLALDRAYRRAGFGIETVGYFEGHGTGTAVGDAVELKTLCAARRQSAHDAPPAAIGSIKANIGHTKAAAGVAGLIKAVMAVRDQILPPTTGCGSPHPALAENGDVLQTLEQGTEWNSASPRRAGVSAMGFGGINAHIVIEQLAASQPQRIGPRQQSLLDAAQDAELFLLAGNSRGELLESIVRVASYAAALSRSELTDLAAELARSLVPSRNRAAVVANSPRELHERLQQLLVWSEADQPSQIVPGESAMIGAGDRVPVVGFLFPGQGSPANLSGGCWRRRFEAVRQLYEQAAPPAGADGVATEAAQPAVATASLAALRVLDRFNIRADVAVGHSFGELTAYHWSGALDEKGLLRLAEARGRALAEFGRAGGAMAGVAAGRAEVECFIADSSIVVAGLNSPLQTVVSGAADEIDALVARAKSQGVYAVRLPVSHAFHSPLVADAEPALQAVLDAETFHRPKKCIASTVTGALVDSQDDLRELLLCQLCAPVRFMDAINAVGAGVDLWIEVGPGNVLTGIAGQFIGRPVVATDAGGESIRPLLQTIGAAYVMGAAIDHTALFENRFARPFDLDWQPRFLANPCEPTAAITEPRSSVKRGHRPKIEKTIRSPLVAAVGDAHPTGSPLDVVRQLVAARTELPIDEVHADFRMLSDLHLSSLAVGEVVAEAARVLNLPPPAAPTEAADATVAALAQALTELAASGATRAQVQGEVWPAGVDAWTREFTVQWDERRLRRPPVEKSTGEFQWFVPDDYPLRDALREAFHGAKAGSGVIVCLPPGPDERHVEMLLASAKAALALGDGGPYVIVQHGGGGAPLARTFFLENRDVTTCVVDIPLDPRAAEWVVAEAEAAVGFGEARYDRNGRRYECALRLLPAADGDQAVPLDADDVLLVTGGGKGIAAECALALAKETGVRLALLGRSDELQDAELSENLRRMRAAGVQLQYLAADVTDRAAVGRAVQRISTELGTVTAVIHGAGSNVPRSLKSLDRESFLQTLAPKLDGLRNVLAAVDGDQLRLLVTFGSIIARSGMHGEADYAVANDWLARLTEDWQAGHPHCHSVCVEWSIWSGVGMGQRLGRVDALKREGITPIPPDEGVRRLGSLVARPLPTTRIVVAGRLGSSPTLNYDRQELPLLRFLERPRVFVPGVELIAEFDLSAETDPYLLDHVYEGEPLFAAVLGLEAMAQAATTLMGSERLPVFEDLRFERPIVAPASRQVTIRVAAIARDCGGVDVVLRSEQTGFQTDHFRVTCRMEVDRSAVVAMCEPLGRDDDLRIELPAVAESNGAANGEPNWLSLDPRRDLYGNILFHTGRFQRISGYRHLRATECVADVSLDGATPWFGQYLPGRLILGDAAARDAVIHAVQACIPHGTILPSGVDRIVIFSALDQPVVVHARERSHDGNDFVYDLKVTGLHGETLEVWEGLRLRRVGTAKPKAPWAAVLLGPCIERHCGDLLPGSPLSVVVERSNADKPCGRRARSDAAIHSALGEAASVYRRADGRPEVCVAGQVSVSHAGDLTVAVAADAAVVACDVEPVAPRAAEVWRDLLGDQRQRLASFIARQAGEDENAAATRLWAALECLTKAGVGLDVPLVYRSQTADGWVVLTAGELCIATWVAEVQGADVKLAFAVLAGKESAIA